MLKTILTGNVGCDAAVVALPGIGDFLEFAVAHQTKKDAPTTWINVMWRKTEYNAKLMHSIIKGCKVLAMGTLTFKPYTDKNGANKVSYTLYAQEVEILTYAKTEQPAPAKATDKPVDSSEKDLPF